MILSSDNSGGIHSFLVAGSDHKMNLCRIQLPPILVPLFDPSHQNTTDDIRVVTDRHLPYLTGFLIM